MSWGSDMMDGGGDRHAARGQALGAGSASAWHRAACRLGKAVDSAALGPVLGHWR
jgi:hypothetical protein